MHVAGFVALHFVFYVGHGILALHFVVDVEHGIVVLFVFFEFGIAGDFPAGGVLVAGENPFHHIPSGVSVLKYMIAAVAHYLAYEAEDSLPLLLVTFDPVVTVGRRGYFVGLFHYHLSLKLELVVALVPVVADLPVVVDDDIDVDLPGGCSLVVTLQPCNVGMDTPKVAISVLAQSVVLMSVPGIAVSADCCLDVYLSDKRTVLPALALALALCYD